MPLHICAGALLSGMLSVQNKIPDINTDTQVITTYQKETFVIPDKYNILYTCPKGLISQDLSYRKKHQLLTTTD